MSKRKKGYWERSTSRAKANQWNKFCKTTRAQIIDEKGADTEYEKLADLAQDLQLEHDVVNTILSISRDERRHKAELTRVFGKVCPRLSIEKA